MTFARALFSPFDPPRLEERGVEHPAPLSRQALVLIDDEAIIFNNGSRGATSTPFEAPFRTLVAAQNSFHILRSAKR